jgi:hypothetical protein
MKGKVMEDRENASEEAKVGGADGFNDRKSLKIIVVAIILALSLAIGWSPLNQASSNVFQGKLTEKTSQATAVMGTSIAAGVAIDAIPVESGKQVAEKIFDIAGYLMVVIGALVAEKILLSFSLIFSFGIIIPIACLLALVFFINRRKVFIDLAIKLCIFAIVFALAIPASVGISLVIDKSFERERKEKISQIESKTKDVDKNKEKINKEAEKSQSSNKSSDKKTVLDSAGNFIGDIGDSVGDFVTNIGKKAKALVSNTIGAAKETLKDLMLITIQWIITACVVPIVTLIGFGFVIKILFGFELNFSGAGSFVHGKTKKGLAKNLLK